MKQSMTHQEAKQQVYMALELVAIALDLADKLLKQPSGIDWFSVADDVKIDWKDSVDFRLMVQSEADLMGYLKEQMIFYSKNWV